MQSDEKNPHDAEQREVTNEDSDKTAILNRRRLFITSALTGITLSATDCHPVPPAACLSQVINQPVDAQATYSTPTDSGVSDVVETAPDVEQPPAACLRIAVQTTDAGSPDVITTPVPCLSRPRPCLEVVAPRPPPCLTPVQGNPKR